jgi:hypothetical protein
MKKVFIVLLALLCAATLVFAADKKTQPKVVPSSSASGSLFAPGNVSAQIGLGSGFFIGGIDLYGGADFGIGQFKVADSIPLTYGAAARVGYFGWSSSYYGYSYSYSDLSIGVLGTLRLSWKDVFPDVKWLSKLESYIGAGLGTYIYSSSYTSDPISGGFHLGFAGLEGNNFYITPNIAINLEGGYYGYDSAGRFGILYKF